MAIIQRIKFDGIRREWLIYRYPGESFVMGTQLIVGEGQVAVFISGGQAMDYFTAGTYTLSTSNLPILQSFVNLPFGGKTPFTAEVYFINKTAKLDMKWGTLSPIPLIDPKYNIKLRIRAFGQFGIRVEDYRVFLTELIGTLNPLEVVSYDKLTEYFRGILVMKANALIAKAIIRNKISALEISASIDEISSYCQQSIGEEFQRFGLRIVNFFVKSINFPDEDFKKLNDILHDKAQFEIIGDQRYVTKRSFDTMEAAAENESGMAGVFAGAGAGVGIGAAVGGAMAGVGSQLDVSVPASQAAGNRCSQCGGVYPTGAVFCSGCGGRIAEQRDSCSACGVLMEKDAKFCSACGAAAALAACSQCGKENAPNAKFCTQCGTGLEG